jgi:hypothetical protein
MNEDQLDAEQLARFYEHLLNMPPGSFRGVHCGTPLFEVPDLEVYRNQCEANKPKADA